MATANRLSSAIRSATGALAMGLALLAPFHAGAQQAALTFDEPLFLGNVQTGTTVTRFFGSGIGSNLWTYPWTSNAYIRSLALWKFWPVAFQNDPCPRDGISGPTKPGCVAVRIAFPSDAGIDIAPPARDLSAGAQAVVAKEDFDTDVWELVQGGIPHVVILKNGHNPNVCLSASGARNSPARVMLADCDINDQAQMFMLFNKAGGWVWPGGF